MHRTAPALQRGLSRQVGLWAPARTAPNADQRYTLHSPARNPHIPQHNVRPLSFPLPLCLCRRCAKSVVTCPDPHLTPPQPPGMPSSTILGARPSSRTSAHTRCSANVSSDMQESATAGEWHDVHSTECSFASICKYQYRYTPTRFPKTSPCMVFGVLSTHGFLLLMLGVKARLGPGLMEGPTGHGGSWGGALASLFPACAPTCA